MIGGVIIGPLDDPSLDAEVLVRAIGPELSSATPAVAGALADPVLKLYNANGDVIASNDDWQNANNADEIPADLKPKNTKESAILTNLVTGEYTAIVNGKDGTTGVALVEVYHIGNVSSAAK